MNKIYNISEINIAYEMAAENPSGFIIVEDANNHVYVQHNNAGNMVVIKDRKEYEICDHFFLIFICSYKNHFLNPRKNTGPTAPFLFPAFLLLSYLFILIYTSYLLLSSYYLVGTSIIFYIIYRAVKNY